MSDDVITDGWKTIYPQGPVEKLYPEACGKGFPAVRDDVIGTYPAVSATYGPRDLISINTATRYGKDRG